MNPVVILYLHQLWGDALKALINLNEDFFVEKIISVNAINQIHIPEEAIIIFETIDPETKLINCLKDLKRMGYRIILTGFLPQNKFLTEIIGAGINGYVLNTSGQEDLQYALKEVYNGNKFFCASITEALNNNFHSNGNNEHQSHITEREQQIIMEFVDLKSSKEIAEKFNISEATVRTHRKNIMHKLGAKNSIALLKYACHEGMLCHKNAPYCQGCYEKK